MELKQEKEKTLFQFTHVWTISVREIRCSPLSVPISGPLYTPIKLEKIPFFFTHLVSYFVNIRWKPKKQKKKKTIQMKMYRYVALTSWM